MQQWSTKMAECSSGGGWRAGGGEMASN